MRLIKRAVLIGVCASLGGCGGGGGGGLNSTPSPTASPSSPPTPTPSPATPISSLQSDQVFAAAAAVTDVALSLPSGVAQSTGARSEAISISYDARSNSYTVHTPSGSQTFAAADARPQRFSGETIYAKGGDTLTMVTTPYYGDGTGNRYVGMGYWQRNAVAGSTQQTSFRTFTYGFETPGAALPRTGSAHWLTDVIGLLTAPGKELRIVQGAADFDVDFAAGAFRLQGFLNENQVVTSGGASGALTLQSGGLLSSTGSFNGLLSYQSGNGIMHGTLAGQFYGPGAEEIGASFSAEGDGNGSVLTGAMTGRRSTFASTSDGIKNISLTGPVASERLGGPGAEIFATDNDAIPGFQDVALTATAASVMLTPTGISSVAFDYQYSPNPQDLVADGRATFTTYKSTVAGAPVTVSLYKAGTANQELALSYTSFVSWIWPRGPGATNLPGETFDAKFAVYGIRTPRDLLTNRTGTATYDGVLYGRGASLGGVIYDLAGRSRFDVDFSAARYTGSLDINGTTQNGSLTDFGHFTFGAAMGYGEMVEAPIAGPSLNPIRISSIQPMFYGPSGQEIGAHFRIELNQFGTPESTALAGVAVAKVR